MSRQYATKKIRYLRAVHSVDGDRNLERELRAVLRRFGRMADCEVAHPVIGTIAVSDRDPHEPTDLVLTLGLSHPNEKMATMGFGVPTTSDTIHAVAPVAGRGWKLADAYCLVDDNEVLVITDGVMRLDRVVWYLQALLEKGGVPLEDRSFDLLARTNRNAMRTLEAEGVAEMQIKSTAYAMTEEIAPPAESNPLKRAFNGLLAGMREAFEREITDEAEREALIEHWSSLNVSAVVKVAGGARREPVLARSLVEVAKDALQDAPEGADVVLTTRKGNPVSASTLTLSTTKTVRRMLGQNDLDGHHAWERLREYRAELIGQNRWKE